MGAYCAKLGLVHFSDTRRPERVPPPTPPRPSVGASDRCVCDRQYAVQGVLSLGDAFNEGIAVGMCIYKLEALPEALSRDYKGWKQREVPLVAEEFEGGDLGEEEASSAVVGHGGVPPEVENDQPEVAWEIVPHFKRTSQEDFKWLRGEQADSCRVSLP